MDWLGNLFLVISIVRLGGRHRDGWLFSVIGNLFWSYYGVSHDLYSVVAIDGLMLVIAANNWRKWS